MKWIVILLVPLLCHCGNEFGGTSVGKSPAVINVSGWDPKEVQRHGDHFSEHNVSAVRIFPYHPNPDCHGTRNQLG